MIVLDFLVYYLIVMPFRYFFGAIGYVFITLPVMVLVSVFYVFPIWLINDVIFPRLFFLLPEKQREKAEARRQVRLETIRLAPVRDRLSAIESRISEIVKQGGEAEDKGMEMVKAIASASPELSINLFEPENEFGGVVLPPNKLERLPSHEFDILMVCKAGVFVIEVKGWRDVNEDGSHVAPDGSLLKPAHKQSQPKVERLRNLLGRDIPVHSLVLLPNMDPLKAPAGLHPAYVCDVSQMQLAIRDKFKMLNGKPFEVERTYETILAALSPMVRAKIEHMRWLAETHPSQNTLDVKRLDDEFGEIRDSRLTNHNWWTDNWRMLLAGSAFVCFWIWLINPYEMVREPFFKPAAEMAGSGSEVDPGPTKKIAGQKPVSKKKPVSKPKAPVVSEEEMARMTAGSIPGEPEWAHSCQTIIDHRGFKVCDPEKNGVVFNEAGQVVMEGKTIKGYTAALMRYCPKGTKRVISTGPLGPLLRTESKKRLMEESKYHWFPEQSLLSHSYICQQ